MIDLGDGNFNVSPGEKIRVNTKIDKPPCVVAFQDPPNGGQWENVVNPPCGQRDFTAPNKVGATISFQVRYDEGIAQNDPDPLARYTTTFISLTNPGDPSSTTTVNVPRGTGPLPLLFTFTTA